jgi:hypothetical protein
MPTLRRDQTCKESVLCDNKSVLLRATSAAIEMVSNSNVYNIKLVFTGIKERNYALKLSIHFVRKCRFIAGQ